MAGVVPLQTAKDEDEKGSTVKRRRLLKSVYVRVKRQNLKKISQEGVGSMARKNGKKIVEIVENSRNSRK